MYLHLRSSSRCHNARDFGSLDARLHNLVQVWILQCRTNAFLISQLSVYGILADMAALPDLHVDPEGWRQGHLQADLDAQPDEGGHAAVRDGGGEGDEDLGVGFVDGDVLQLDDVQLFQGKGMLWVIYVPYQIYKKVKQ